PVWLSPEQARIIPITDDQHSYAREIEARLKQAGVRASADLGSDRMNAKIRAAQQMQVPYMLVVGGQEMENGTVAPRLRSGARMEALSVSDFIARIQAEIRNRVQAPELQ
ncbi:MAG: threonine--tRNA ligase, partial [Anaerolineales bacterium]|nr:threonine--tRNA ligase [Anaerolineales bacterium]